MVRSEKREKYIPLVTQLKIKYNRWVDFIPIVIGATGVVSKETVIAIERLGVGLDIKWLQEITAKATCDIFRQIL